MTASFFKTDFTFRLGARQFTLTPPAKVLLFAYVAKFAIFVLLGVAALLGAIGGPAVRPLVAGLLTFTVLIEPLVIAYLVYLNNCLVVGDCYVLAWILAAIGVATSVIAVAMVVLPLLGAKR